jgi:hypothetical protein
MAELKTTPNDASVEAFLDGIENEIRRRDAYDVLKLMKRVTKKKPRMWGSSIVGFGSYHYKYDSGREGEWFLTGFSPRKQDLTLYIMPGIGRFPALTKKLGRHKTGKSCLYIKNLDGVDRSVLQELIEESLEYLKERYP